MKGKKHHSETSHFYFFYLFYTIFCRWSALCKCPQFNWTQSKQLISVIVITNKFGVWALHRFGSQIYKTEFLQYFRTNASWITTAEPSMHWHPLLHPTEQTPCPPWRLCGVSMAGAAAPQTSPAHPARGLVPNPANKVGGPNQKVHHYSPRFRKPISFLEKLIFYSWQNKTQAYWLFAPSEAGSGRFWWPCRWRKEKRLLSLRYISRSRGGSQRRVRPAQARC